jgi:hypothetical protein
MSSHGLEIEAALSKVCNTARGEHLAKRKEEEKDKQ